LSTIYEAVVNFFPHATKAYIAQTVNE